METGQLKELDRWQEQRQLLEGEEGTRRGRRRYNVRTVISQYRCEDFNENDLKLTQDHETGCKV